IGREVRALLELFCPRGREQGVSHRLRTLLRCSARDRESLMSAVDRRSYRGYYFLIAIMILALDQVSKLFIVRNIPLHDTVTLIPGFFSLSHVLNPGAAFSLFG